MACQVLKLAEKMLCGINGIRDVRVISNPGRLTDHYNPSDKTVNGGGL
jgi:Zn-dependent membrane protease YugP